MADVFKTRKLAKVLRSGSRGDEEMASEYSELRQLAPVFFGAILAAIFFCALAAGFLLQMASVFRSRALFFATVLVGLPGLPVMFFDDAQFFRQANRFDLAINSGYAEYTNPNSAFVLFEMVDFFLQPFLGVAIAAFFLVLGKRCRESAVQDGNGVRGR